MDECGCNRWICSFMLQHGRNNDRGRTGEKPALGIAFIVMLVCLGTMQGTEIGFCVGYLVARLKRRKEQPDDANHPAA